MPFTQRGSENAADGFSDRIASVGLYLNNNEIQGNAYARAPTDGGDWAEAQGRSVNNANIEFPTPTANWGNVNKFRVFNSAGQQLGDGDLTNARNIAIGSNVRFAAGSLRVRIPSV